MNTLLHRAPNRQKATKLQHRWEKLGLLSRLRVFHIFFISNFYKSIFSQRYSKYTRQYHQIKNNFFIGSSQKDSEIKAQEYQNQLTLFKAILTAYTLCLLLISVLLVRFSFIFFFHHKWFRISQMLTSAKKPPCEMSSLQKQSQT